jgi:pSer/pThr/pTyr-binding forkhead associated (FHA) protein
MRSWIIGGGAECDVVVDSPTVSARHCRLTQTPDGYVLEDLGSTNGTFVNGVRLATSSRVTRSDTITLGRTLPMPWPAALGPSAASVVVRVGREPDNDVVVNLPMVSGHHAQVFWEGGPAPAIIADLGSSNGTALGSPDRKITRAALSADDTIYLGSHPLPAALLLARLHRSLVPNISFHENPLVIGRDPACDMVLDLPVVSGQHARLIRRDDRIVLEDLGSSNGTSVNGQRIDRPTTVKDGDVIGLGSHALILAERSPITAAAPMFAHEQDAGVRTVIASAEVVQHSPRSAGFAYEVARALKQPWRLAALLAQAPLLAILLVAVWGAKVPEPTTAESLKAASNSIGALLSWVSIAAIWFGLSDAIAANLLDSRRLRQGLTSEGATGLLARLSVLTLLVLVQCVVFWAMVASFTELKAPPLPAVALLVLAAAVGLVLGLVIVLLAPRPTVSWACAAAAMLFFWAFGGGPQPPSRMPDWGKSVSSAAPSRWAFEGLLLLESDRHPPIGAGTGSKEAENLDLADGYFPAESARMGPSADATALGSMFIGLIAAAAFISLASQARS